MRVYEASMLISAEFGGIRDLSRHLSLNLKDHKMAFTPKSPKFNPIHSSPEHQSPCPRYLNIAYDRGSQKNEFKLYFKKIPGAVFAKSSLQVF